MAETKGDPDPPASAQTSDAHDVYIPDGGYGWVCVGSCFAINAFSWGIVATFGVYLTYYLNHDLYPAATRIDYSFVGGLVYTGAMLSAPFVTHLTQTIPIRLLMLAGAAMFAAGFVAASFATRFWHLYLTQGLLVGLGTGFMYVPSMAIIPQWFDRRRSLASAVAASGSGVGGIVFGVMSSEISQHVSLQWSLRAVGIGSFVLNAAAVVLIRDRNDVVKPVRAAFDFRLLRRFDVLLLLGWGLIMMIGYTILQFSMSDSARAIGLSAAQANLMTILLSAGTVFGRPLTGFFSDWLGRIAVAAWLTFATAVLILTMWLPSTSLGVSAVFAVLAGAIYGTYWATIVPLCAEIVGLKQLPSLLSFAWLITVVPCTFAEAIGLKLVRNSWSRPYLIPIALSGITYIIGGICLALLWKIHVYSKRPK